MKLSLQNVLDWKAWKFIFFKKSGSKERERMGGWRKWERVHSCFVFSNGKTEHCFPSSWLLPFGGLLPHSACHQLATGNRCQSGWHGKEQLHDRGNDTCIIFLGDKEMEKHVLLQCTKGKDKCPCYEEAIEIENSSSGRTGKKKAYPSSHNGSFYREMTEHKCSTKPSMINSETGSLEAPNQSQSQTFSIFWVCGLCTCV